MPYSRLQVWVRGRERCWWLLRWLAVLVHVEGTRRLTVLLTCITYTLHLFVATFYCWTSHEVCTDVATLSFHTITMICCFNICHLSLKMFLCSVRYQVDVRIINSLLIIAIISLLLPLFSFVLFYKQVLILSPQSLLDFYEKLNGCHKAFSDSS